MIYFLNFQYIFKQDLSLKYLSNFVFFSVLKRIENNNCETENFV